MSERNENSKNPIVAARSENFPGWYASVLKEAGWLEVGPIAGTIVMKPGALRVWKEVQRSFGSVLEEKGIEDYIFPSLIPEEIFAKEQMHLDGFVPDIAIVTILGGKSREEGLVLRPTSETIITNWMRGQIRTPNDLPLKVHQWGNVFRWERRTKPLIRDTEFLWQEGHTAHSTQEEADSFALEMLESYKTFLQETLAIPVMAGPKPESEKFMGALRTYTLEAMMQDGRSLQLATSHNLGQNFSRVFDVKYRLPDGLQEYVWQTSWGMSTRVLGALVMVHGDDTGIILPPRIAPDQVVLIPVAKDSQDSQVLGATFAVRDELKKAGIRLIVDTGEERLGEKRYRYERKGVPLRVEIGAREIESNTILLARRDNGEKVEAPQDRGPEIVAEVLGEIQESLFAKAAQRTVDKTVWVNGVEELQQAVKDGKFALVHWLRVTTRPRLL